MFKYLFLACMVLISSTGRAYDLHLNLEKEAQKVLLPKANALTLEQVKKMVVNEDLDIQISYERLIEAQKKIGVARAAYFPYGLGTVAAMYFFNVWNPLILVELITSLPSKVYNVQAEKNMSLAQKYSLEALRQNVKTQVSHLYYGILKEETALKITALNMVLMEEMIRTSRDRVELGLATEEEVIEHEQSLRRMRDTYLQFSSYLGEAKAAFNVMLGQSPDEGKEIELQPVSDFLVADEFQREIKEMVRMAVQMSNEIVAADYMVTAALKAKKSAKWSVLSFGGIGFGFYARIQVAGSKVEEAHRNRQIVEETLVNQVYSMDNAFKKSLSLVRSEKEIFTDTTFYMNTELEKFKSGHLSLDKLLETQMYYLKDYNEMVQSHYLSLIKLADEERVIMGSARGTPEEAGDFNVALNDRDNRYDLSVTSDTDSKIVKVRYEFDGYLGLRPMTSLAADNDFLVTLKLYEPESVAGTVEITLESGEVITKLFNFKQ